MRLGKLLERRVDGWAIGLAVLIVAAPLVSYGLTLASGLGIAILLVLQVAVAIGIWAIPNHRRKVAEAERLEARSETRVVLGDALDPLMLELAELAATKSKLERKGRDKALLQTVLAAATGLGEDGARTRASYFEYREGEAGEPAELVHQKSTGRAVQAKARFVEHHRSGDVAIDIVRSDGYLFCDDVDESAPEGWEPSERGEYKTFASVAVVAGGHPYGMLTLDSPNPGDLADEDRQLLHVYGRILAAGLEICA